jgi:hypothetical protein
MGAKAFWQKTRLAPRAEMVALKKWFATLIVGVKKGIVEIAVARSSQQFGREEEKE